MGRHFDETHRELLAHDESDLRLVLDIDPQEEEQRAEDPDASVELDIPAGMIELNDWAVRESARGHLIGSIARYRGVWLSDQALDHRNRPGPAPGWLAEAQALDTHDIVGLRDTGPGCFVLPAPPRRSRKHGEPRWDELAEDVITRRLERDRMRNVRFEGAVALDVAFRAAKAPITQTSTTSPIGFSGRCRKRFHPIRPRSRATAPTGVRATRPMFASDSSHGGGSSLSVGR